LRGRAAPIKRASRSSIPGRRRAGEAALKVKATPRLPRDSSQTRVSRRPEEPDRLADPGTEDTRVVRRRTGKTGLDVIAGR